MNWNEPEVYAAIHNNERVRVESRSGGIFTAISDCVFDFDGVVYGCVLTDDFQAVHIRADKKTIRDLMRGSKYIQSKLGNTYRNIMQDLNAGKSVLFSGTSCQIAGLRGFLGKEYEKLICIDIVCHGVPSTVVWKNYLVWQEKRNKAKVVSVDFRNKKDFGWRSHIETLTMDNGKRISSGIFKNLFYGHCILRPSCYECPYKSITHPGDITIADYWGIEKVVPDFDDDKGVSLVLINNDKGSIIFKKIKENINWKSTKIEDSMQPPLRAPFPRPNKRDVFWEDLRVKDFGYIAKKYGGNSLRYNVKRKLRTIKRRLLR